MKCLYCENEFELRPIGKSGGRNRQLCYDCLPEGIEDKVLLSSASDYFLRKKAAEEKIARGCDICGYNKCAAALEWHHTDDNKEDNPSNFLKKGSWEGYLLYKKETEKCMLLCTNCHRELHDSQRQDKSFVGSDKYEVFRKEVCQKYLETKNLTKTAQFFKKDPDTIKRILEYCNIAIVRNSKKPVEMLDKETGKVLETFSSLEEASLYLGKGHCCSGHISQACLGTRKSAYGYRWRYIGP